MRISQIHLQNFKRFTDLKINLGEKSPKLILLIGANGSGKSGVFDAFELIARYPNTGGITNIPGASYYVKNKVGGSVKIIFEDNTDISSNILLKDRGEVKIQSTSNLNPYSFYGRSAIRYLPRIKRTTIGQLIEIEKNADKPQYYIDADQRFENDIDVLIKNIIYRIFKGINQSSSEQLDEIKAFLNLINEALPRIFGEETNISLKFLRPVTPSDGQPSQLIFAKGGSEINYDLLSSGEKEVINILFNLFVRTPLYQDTIYFFDELDAHLHTSLQYNLLKEIVENWIPENCQVWTATHSLGFIQYAQVSDDAAIIDFDNHDFDLPIILAPQKNQEIFDIAVPKDALTLLFKDKRLIFCEGQNAALLNSVGFQNMLFLGDIDKSSITLRVEQDKAIHGLIDRDYLSDNERLLLNNKLPNLHILEYYCFENYLYHPENIKSIYEQFDIDRYIKEIKDVKNSTKNRIIQKLDNDRKSYIFYKRDLLSNRNEDYDQVVSLLQSDDFEEFYKVFSMKKRGNICKIHNLNQEQLVKTPWFQSKIKAIIP
jgi:AAA15 family ATPase/GTPase